MTRDGKRKKAENQGKNLPKVKIPLSFEKAVEGLLAVKPDKKNPVKKNAQK